MPTKPRIVVADDFVDGREMVAEYLAFRGFDVFEAGDGGAAIEIARRVRPCIVLMDLAMPGIDGWEATRRLKTDPATKNIMVIVVSAHALDGAEASARQAGCDAYIPKPNDLAVLGDMLWQWVYARADLSDPTDVPIEPTKATTRRRKRVSRSS